MVATFWDNLDGVLAIVGAAITCLVAWADMRSRVKEHDKRLEEHSNRISELEGAHDSLRDQHVKSFADVKVMLADIRADIKVVRSKVDTEERR